MTTLVDGTVPVAADFNGNYTALNQVCGTTTAITGYTVGDILYASATTALSKLPIGTAGQVLGISAGVPAWGLTASGLTGASNLKIVPHDPAQGTWVNATTTYAAVAAPTAYNLFDSTLNDGHIISDAAQFGAVNYMITVKGNPTTVTYQYWNGAWTALTTLATPNYNTLGFQQLRFTIPGDWVIGGSGTGIPASSFNIRVQNTVGAATVTGRASLANKVDITADEVTLSTAGGATARHTSVSLLATDIRLASNVNGRDQAGALGASSWAYLYITSDGTTPHGLWSASATAPTLQGSDTYKVRVAGFRIDANSLLQAMAQFGRRTRLIAPIKDATARASSTDAAALTLTVPAEAVAVRVQQLGNASGYYDLGSRPYTSTGAAATLSTNGGELKFGNAQIGLVIEVELEVAQTIYTAQAAGNYDMWTYGWIFPGNLN